MGERSDMGDGLGTWEDETARKKPVIGEGNKAAARRCLNLFFSLYIASTPRNTSFILNDQEIGYAELNVDAAKQAFYRDRKTLEKAGIYIRELTPETDEDAPARKRPASKRAASKHLDDWLDGDEWVDWGEDSGDGSQDGSWASMTEESSWELDRDRTYSHLDEQSPDTLAALLERCSELDESPFWKNSSEYLVLKSRLQGALSRRNGTDFPRTIDHLDDAPEDPWINRLFQCYQDRTRIRIDYENAQGEQRSHETDVYGFFTVGGCTYFVGYDPDYQLTLTYRTDRIKTLTVLKTAYRIPESFHVEDHVFLPFDFSNKEPVKATFSFAPETSEMELSTITKGRGSLEGVREPARWLWHVEVRDLDAAASMSLANTSIRMRPVSPPELVDAWTGRIQKAVTANGGN